jgi:hypothetical protein
VQGAWNCNRHFYGTQGTMCALQFAAATGRSGVPFNGRSGKKKACGPQDEYVDGFHVALRA